ncbi:hypothetical protein [Roseateles sp. MS654]|uniref:hypothetical protein n=1 Tax=Roseateles sp. MS654 TaxID=3412685 RepID=UPI003C2D3A1B
MPVPLAPEALRASLRTSVDALQRRQANEIPEDLIDRLVELDWLEWRGGALRLTTTGENIYRKELAQWRASTAQAPATDPAVKETPMAKPNYQFEKRQRELAKQKKKQEKAQRKAAPARPADEDAPKEPNPA